MAAVYRSVYHWRDVIRGIARHGRVLVERQRTAGDKDAAAVSGGVASHGRVLVERQRTAEDNDAAAGPAAVLPVILPW
jgi:hypothetical protein